ncbi:MAG: methyltransferase [bacterium]
MKEIFERVYNEKFWYKGSGAGSLPQNTIALRKLLQTYFREQEIHSLLDLGCGDWKMMRLMDLTEISYFGIDIVPTVIENDKNQFERGTIHFLLDDIRTAPLPPADLVLLKDVLQHWSQEEILSFLPRLRPYRHVLVLNTCVGGNLNGPILTGGNARPIDLSKPPFNFRIAELLRYQSYRPMKKIYETKNLVRLYLT